MSRKNFHIRCNERPYQNIKKISFEKQYEFGRRHTASPGLPCTALKKWNSQSRIRRIFELVRMGINKQDQMILLPAVDTGGFFKKDKGNVHAPALRLAIFLMICRVDLPGICFTLTTRPPEASIISFPTISPSL